MDNGTFAWPADLPTCMDVSSLFNPLPPGFNPRAATPPVTNKYAFGNVLVAEREMRQRGITPETHPCFVDLDCSKGGWYDKFCPCITKSRGGIGYWVTSLGRRLVKEEMMRFMGMNPQEFVVVVSDTALGNQIGNSMSVNVLQRLLTRLLPAAGLIDASAITDHWETGRAQQILLSTAGMPFPKRCLKRKRLR